MLEKEFVPHDRALPLKELGFDEPCLGGYIRFRGSGTFELAFYKYRNVDFNTTSNIYVSAPLYQQAFRWFREKHNILANVYANASGFLYQWEDAVGGTHRGYSDFEGPNDSGVWDTYEEAELACLDKLIQLVKEAKEL
jgi:hypothetical protein